jgi:uncharacterized repeat protein (TIGR03806 family)
MAWWWLIACRDGPTTDTDDEAPYALTERPANPTCLAPERPPFEPDPESPFPDLLSETGCFEADDRTTPVAGAIPYDVAVSFWSDAADKERWLAIPDGTAITVGDDGDWDLPAGSVLIKHFRLFDLLFETRLFVRHDDGGWAGYGYVWEGADAGYVWSSFDEDVVGQPWHYPSSGECSMCHTGAAGGSLGLETGQLDIDFTYPNGRESNQVETLAYIGVLEALPSARGAYPDPYFAPELESGAKAWLHVNCSGCHRPGASLGFDLTYATAFADAGLCGEPASNDLGLPGLMLVAPGDPATSALSIRIHANDATKMPPIGRNLVDDAGAALIDAWIESLTACP